MYYKTTDEKVWFLDDVEFEYVLPEGSVEITEEEAKLLAAPPPPTIEELNYVAKVMRANAYKDEADAIFFKAQRGEANIDDWISKVAEIKNKFPYINN